MREGNGDNRFWIEIKCPYIVFEEEWLDLLIELNHFLKEYKDGFYSNVGAFLCDEDDL
jgi:hypothetical protein